MSAWAVVAFHDDASSQGWGPFRSYAKARALFDELHQIFPGDTVLLCEPLGAPPSRSELRAMAEREEEIDG